MPKYQAPDQLLKDRIILITGAASGLGKAIALAYAQHGATTILLDKNVSNLESVYDEIEELKYPKPALYPLDLGGATAENYVEMAETIDKEFGRLDGLVHNAAVMGPITPMSLYSPEDWYNVLQINLNAPFLINLTCIPLLNESADARMLYVGDACGQQGSAYWGAYGVSKSGQENMMQILADELESNTNIRVNSIDPGSIRTQMRAFAYPGEDPEINPTPEDVIPGFLYLMGPDSKEYTGRSFLAEDFI
ncbi:MAG: YciK family oxidoreductase [Gammaproteobacteria bacterium]|nr:YciK family oxidoreductase [Gammaproteobacteria bacterium]